MTRYRFLRLPWDKTLPITVRLLNALEPYERVHSMQVLAGEDEILILTEYDDKDVPINGPTLPVV